MGQWFDPDSKKDKPLYGRNSKIDWKVLKRDYIYGWQKDGKTYFPSYTEVADRHGVAQNTVATKGAQQGWAAEREIVQNRLQEQMMKKKQESLVDESVEFDKLSYGFAKAAMHIASNRLVTVTPEGKHKPNLDIDSMEFKRISDVAETAQKVGKTALGEKKDKNSSIDKLLEIFGEYWDDSSNEENNTAINSAVYDID